MNVNSINSINSLTQLNRVETGVKGLGLFDSTRSTEQASFQELLLAAVEHLNQAEKTAEAYTQKIATGDLENFHEATTAATQAQITLDFALQIRTRVLDAYREITRMQI